MINLKFYSFKERRPEHNQEIVLFSGNGSYYAYDYSMTHETVEYQWKDYDCGDSFCYNGEDAVEHCSLSVIVNGADMTDSTEFFWCSQQEYWEAVDKG